MHNIQESSDIYYNSTFLFYYYHKGLISKAEPSTPSGGKKVFHKKPLERRRHLISCFARSETANLVSTTSGTERKRGFAGILPCRSVPFDFNVNGIINKYLILLFMIYPNFKIMETTISHLSYCLKCLF